MLFYFFQFLPNHYVCREQSTDCDVPEMCPGNSGEVSTVLYYVAQVSNWAHEPLFLCYMASSSQLSCHGLITVIFQCPANNYTPVFCQ